MDIVIAMTQEVRADYTELTRLAADVLTAADGLADGLGTARDSFGLTAAMFGNSTAGSGVYDAQQQAAEGAGTAVDRIVQVLEDDVDRLYGVAFAYQKADQDAAEEVCRRGRLGGPTLC